MVANKFDGSITELELKRLEHHEVLDAADFDRSWWLFGGARFPEDSVRDDAIDKGVLVKVVPTDAFAFAADVRSRPELQYARVEVVRMLEYLFRELDRRTNFKARGIKLIITSLHRTDAEQVELIDSEFWYRVAPLGTSAHGAGAAFDINVRTHYVWDEMNGEWLGTWKEGMELRYAPDVMEHLADLLAELANMGICNFIVENHISGSDYTPSCFHVCVSPNIQLPPLI